MPGIQFVQYLKSSGFFQDIPIVAFGNPERHEAIAGMLHAGARIHLLRPFGVQEIAQLVSKIFVQNMVA
jgi:DNA-binding NarL/FixJ family response regulator